MLASGALLEPQIFHESIPNRDWMAGALAGLITQRNKHAESWEWSCFIDDLEHRLGRDGITEPIWPGASHVDGSHYDTLGGYISTCGIAGEDGLKLPVPAGLKNSILNLLSEVAVCLPDGWIMIPINRLEHFTNLVTIRGPLSSLLEVVM